MSENTKELSTEERFEEAFQLYELDCENWPSDILLEELESLYLYRERINKLILMAKDKIMENLK